MPVDAVDAEHRRGVAADRHERAVPERDLAAVAGEDRKPEQGDEVHADGRELVRREARDEPGQQHDQGGEREEGEHLDRELAPHTRRTATRPKRPFGFTSRTIRMIRSAVGSLSVSPTNPTYRPSRVIETPSSRPPTTAPTGLSRPPSTAAAKAYSRIVCIMFGSRKRIGATIIPATAPSTAASPQPNASIQPTRTPT